MLRNLYIVFSYTFMPIAIIAAVVVVIVGIVGFMVSRNDAPAATEAEPIEETTSAPVDTNVTDAGAPNETPVPNTPDTAETSDAMNSNEMDDATMGEPDATEAADEIDLEVSDAAESTYTDGTYTAVASYPTPRNVVHEITVELTVENNIVTAASVLYDGAAAETPSHKKFEDAYTPEVVGVALDEIELSRTGGASLTSESFNEAVAAIKAEAA